MVKNTDWSCDRQIEDGLPEQPAGRSSHSAAAPTLPSTQSEPAREESDRKTDLVYLIARAKAGDQSAFESLKGRFAPLVHHICRRYLSNTADIEDAVQDVFIRAWQSLRSFRGDSFAGWLGTTSKRVCLTKLLKEKEARAREILLNSPAGGGRSAEDEYVNNPNWILEAIERVASSAKSRWDDLDRAIFWLYYFQEMNIAEIASHLGRRRSTVDARFRRHVEPIIEKVREEFENS